MVIHLIALVYFGFFFEICPFFWDILDGIVIVDPKIFFFTLFTFFTISFFVCISKEPYNNNEDVSYKFSTFFFRAISVFFTLLFSRIKRFFYFLKNFKHSKSYNTFKGLSFLIFGFMFIIWRPLFRK